MQDGVLIYSLVFVYSKYNYLEQHFRKVTYTQHVENRNCCGVFVK
jgi:hypothetical protein